MHVQTATGSTAGLDETSIGAKGSFAGATIAIGKKQEDASGTKTDSSDLAIKYAVNDALTVSFLRKLTVNASFTAYLLSLIHISEPTRPY